MNTDNIIELAREAGIEWQENYGMSGKKRMSTSGSQSIERIEHFAALVTQAERESRQAAQVENEQLKARLARSGVEMRRAVLAEREACKAVCKELLCVSERSAKDGDHFEIGRELGHQECLDAIRARNHVVDANKMDCTDCECADNDPCKRTAPGLALESGEFVPASEIAYHPV